MRRRGCRRQELCAAADVPENHVTRGHAHKAKAGACPLSSCTRTRARAPTAVNDMFWDQPWDEDEAIRQCEEQWGVAPRPLHATIE